MWRKISFDWQADKIALGKKTILRPLRHEDLEQMAAWPRNDDASEAPFADFARDWASMEAWYRVYDQNPNKQMWSIFDSKGKIIGRLGISLVDRDHQEGLLSIRFRTDCTGRGYGFDCMVPILDHWFFTLDMKVMVLDVSILNQRAVRLYEKLGFRLIGYHWVPVAQKYVLPGVSDAGFVRYLDMQLDREDWLKNKE